jgi:plastocyanin
VSDPTRPRQSITSQQEEFVHLLSIRLDPRSLALIAVVAVFAACGGAAATPAGATPAGATPAAATPAAATPAAATPAGATQAVSIVDFGFNPASLTVPVNATVTWTNTGGATHTVTSTSGAFDSKSLASGATFSWTFTAAGTYAYVCSIHSSMKGTIVVTP